MMGSEPANVVLGDGTVVDHPLTMVDHERLGALWGTVGLAVLGSYLAAFVGLIARYRRGDETQRRQLLWLLLSLCVVTAYVALVALLGQLLNQRFSTIAAALAVALAFNPARLAAQRLVDRVVYGDAHDPVRAVARVDDHLGRSHDLSGLLDALRDALRVPYAELRTDEANLTTGSPPPHLHSRRLVFADTHVGMRAGACGYVLKGATQGDIERAIRTVAAGGAFLGPQIARRVLELLSDPRRDEVPFPELTRREREVLDLVASGLPNRQIATRLSISGKTVSNHISNIFAKLHLSDRAAAIVRARDAGLGRG